MPAAGTSVIIPGSINAVAGFLKYFANISPNNPTVNALQNTPDTGELKRFVMNILTIQPNAPIRPDFIIEFDDDFFIEKVNEQFKLILNDNERNRWKNIFKDKIDGHGRKRIIDRLLC